MSRAEANGFRIAPSRFCAQLAQSARHRSLGGVSMEGATIVSPASRGEVPK
jgi:hypothetical protein